MAVGGDVERVGGREERKGEEVEGAAVTPPAAPTR